MPCKGLEDVGRKKDLYKKASREVCDLSTAYGKRFHKQGPHTCQHMGAVASLHEACLLVCRNHIPSMVAMCASTKRVDTGSYTAQLGSTMMTASISPGGPIAAHSQCTSSNKQLTAM